MAANLQSACGDGDGDGVIGELSTSPAATDSTIATIETKLEFPHSNGIKDEEALSPALDELCSDENSVYGTPEPLDTENNRLQNCPSLSPETDADIDEEEEEEEEEERSSRKLKPEPIELEITGMPLMENEITEHPTTANGKTGKKSKKRSKDVWSTTSRKGKKKAKNNNHNESNFALQEDKVLITPISRFPEKEEDGPDLKIRLSKVYKAEKVELGEDRLTTGSTKGYRMVRATRGVDDGAWYFEIKVVHLGKTGHTRLGWSTEKGELQAPVGYDKNSFGYRDIDGSKVHKALREKYGGEGYKEGDVIGFYINLPHGGSYAPKPPRYVWYKGQRYVCAPDDKEDPPKVVPGSEIAYYKNGTCQGVAFRNLYGGRYYPAASMYTLPNQPNCVVKFNFGPDFECFPDEFVDRPIPRPMIEVPYQSYDDSVENSGSIEKKQ